MTTTRQEILLWVNRIFKGHRPTTFSSLQEVPGKAIGKLLNAIFGQRCPLNKIRFDDDTPTACLRNRRTVLELARGVGFDGRLDAVKWTDGNDFANELCFWKWLYGQGVEQQFDDTTSGYDFSLQPAVHSFQRLDLQRNIAPQDVLSAVASKRPREESLVETGGPPRRVGCASSCETTHSVPLHDIDADDMTLSTRALLSLKGTCERCADIGNEALRRSIATLEALEAKRVAIVHACLEDDCDRLITILEAC